MHYKSENSNDESKFSFLFLQIVADLSKLTLSISVAIIQSQWHVNKD